MSPKSAGLAKKSGFKNVKVYVQGLPGWKKASNRTEPTIEFVKSGNVVIVDVRSPESVAAGHIPRAYNFPAQDYEWAEYALPMSMSAPIIIYSDNDADIKMAVKATKKWGYKIVLGYYNGLEAWTAAELHLATGPTPKADVDNIIPYTRKLGQGQISINDFENTLKSEKATVVDLRTADDYALGHFPGTLNIPLDDLKERISDIAKETPLVVHCQTGARSEIAYNILKQEGYDVKYLMAECKFLENGEYEIW